MTKQEFKVEFRRWVACWGLPPECYQDKTGGILPKANEKALFYWEQQQSWPIEQMRAVFDRLVQSGVKWFPSWPVVQECYDNLFPPEVKDDAAEAVDAARSQFQQGLVDLRRLPIEEFRSLERVATDMVSDEIKTMPPWLVQLGMPKMLLELKMVEIYQAHKRGAKHEG